MDVRNPERLASRETSHGPSQSRDIAGVIDLTESSASSSKEKNPATSTPIQEFSWVPKKPLTLPCVSCGDDYEVSMLAHMACNLLPLDPSFVLPSEMRGWPLHVAEYYLLIFYGKRSPDFDPGRARLLPRVPSNVRNQFTTR